MSTEKTERLMGVSGSPYTLKMLGLLRYRRIPYQVSWGQPGDPNNGLPKPKVGLLPTFYNEDDSGQLQAEVDSTPIIRRLEREHSGRSVIPDSASLAFIDFLLEDFADEWSTKYMFHYRWHFKADIDWAGTIVPLYNQYTVDDERMAQSKAKFTKLQTGRLGVIGSNAITASIIESSYLRFLTALENHLTSNSFILGEKPSACDFAIYGQFTQLTGVDPTPMALARKHAPRCCAWVDSLSDLSGLDINNKNWFEDGQVPDSLIDLLKEVGKVYTPTMIANAKALVAGEAEWETQIDGQLWQQQSFPYQGKCLMWLKGEYEKLSASEQGDVDKLLQGTGCEPLLFK